MIQPANSRGPVDDITIQILRWYIVYGIVYTIWYIVYNLPYVYIYINDVWYRMSDI